MDIKDKVIQDVWNYMFSRTILTAAELDIFTPLEKKHYTAKELAEILSLDQKALTRILDCLTAYEYLDKKDDRYFLTDKGALLSANHEQTVRPMILHINDIWENWSNLTETVQQGKNPSQVSVTEKSQETCQAFIEAMDVVARDLAQEIAAEYDASSFSHLLDIGGASGTYVVAFLNKNPHLKATLFDLPQVIPMAEKRLQKEGLLERVECLAGDYYQDGVLPSGADLALLSAIIHQNSPQENQDLFRKIFESLQPGGAILIRDHIMEPDRTYPPAGALFALNMLVNTSGGDTYTFHEIKTLLEQAGFSNVRFLREGPKMDCLVEARKP